MPIRPGWSDTANGLALLTCRKAKLRAHAGQIRCDGHRLLAAIALPGAPTWLRELPAVELLGAGVDLSLVTFAEDRSRTNAASPLAKLL
jgi:hypothetical protein